MVIIAHRILIGTAIAFGVYYTLWELGAYRRTLGMAHLLVALATAVVTVALGYYLKNLKRFVG